MCEGEESRPSPAVTASVAPSGDHDILNSSRDAHGPTGRSGPRPSDRAITIRQPAVSIRTSAIDASSGDHTGEWSAASPSVSWWAGAPLALVKTCARPSAPRATYA